MAEFGAHQGTKRMTDNNQGIGQSCGADGLCIRAGQFRQACRIRVTRHACLDSIDIAARQALCQRQIRQYLARNIVHQQHAWAGGVGLERNQSIGADAHPFGDIQYRCLCLKRMGMEQTGQWQARVERPFDQVNQFDREKRVAAQLKKIAARGADRTTQDTLP